MVYQVDGNRVVVIVVAVGKRENLTVYRAAGRRVKE
jgi:mRNA interferase RelE/StbE